MEMASSAITPEPAPQASTFQRKNLRNPLPLSAAQEAEVRNLYYKRVRTKCADEVKAFAICAKGRTFSTSWACRTEHFAMNSCMIAHATRAEEDAAREEWFTGREERRRKREEDFEAQEKRRAEVIEMTRQQEARERLALEEKQRVASGGSPSSNETSQKKGWWR